jgi:hypothetical protein
MLSPQSPYLNSLKFLAAIATPIVLFSLMLESTQARPARLLAAPRVNFPQLNLPQVKISETTKSLSVSFDPPSKPSHPGQPAQTAGGGTRGKCPQDLKEPEPSLALIIPATNSGMSPGMTVSAYPTFLAYLPTTASRQLEFSLLVKNKGAGETWTGFYQKTFSTKGQMGIFSFKLPQDSPPLEIGVPYRWSFAVICSSEMRDADLVAEGQIQRIELPATVTSQILQASPLERSRLYERSGVWYDAVEAVATELRKSSSNSAALALRWQELMQLGAGSLAQISQSPFVDCCQAEVLGSNLKPNLKN